MAKQRYLAAAAFGSALLGSAASAAEPSAAPAFSVAAQSGQISLDDLKGKVVYLDFWASWCGPCRQSFKWLNNLNERHGGQGLAVLGINVDADRSAAERFLKANPAMFRIAYDPDGKVAATYQVKGMPSSYLIDRQGRVRTAHIGFRERDKVPLEAEIQALLGEAGGDSK